MEVSVTPVGGPVRGDGGGADQRTRMTYRSALQIIIDRNASDPYGLGTFEALGVLQSGLRGDAPSGRAE